MTIVIKRNTPKSEIKEILKKFDKKISKRKGFDAKKYCGAIESFKVLSVNEIRFA